MPEHYTKNTLESTAYCKVCKRGTQHRVDSGRRGPCLDCLKKLKEQNEFERIKKGIEEFERSEYERKNPKLF
jgi:ribosomal protein L44E